MINQVEAVKKQIEKVIEDAIFSAIKKGSLCEMENINILIEAPKEQANGDFSCNIAMQASKIQKMKPTVIAEILIENMNTQDTYIKRVEVAGPGFINFYLKDAWCLDVLPMIEKVNCDYGRVDIGNGKKLMVEFVSANPTGPMHMGNARGGALGDCLALVLAFAGYDVTKEFYVNDAGNQIEKFGMSLEARYLQLILGEDKIEFPEDGYHGDDIILHMQEFIKLYGDKYINVPSDERKKAFVSFALPRNLEKIKSDMERYRINFDVWFYESELFKTNEVFETINILKENGYTYEKDDAVWFRATDFGSEKDDVLVRANGVPTYLASDIAYHRNKFVKRGFDKVIDIWGADHHGHIARLKGALKALLLDDEKLSVIIMQLVRLMRGGEVARMSKRSGKSITLSDLLDETSIDAARFFFNLRQANSHLDFDLDLAIEKSNENPVFYVQYAHARICSIIRITEQEGIFLKNADAVDFSLLKEKEELELVRHLCYFPEYIKNAAKAFEPSCVTRYILDLASLFHSFYNACRVKCDDEGLMNARLSLCNCVRIVMRNIFNLIGIDAPEKM